MPQQPSTAAALRAILISPNETDSNMEPANVVDGLFAIARSITRLAGTMERSAHKRESRDESLTAAIRSISHGDVHGPAGLEMLSMAINGDGTPGQLPVSAAISTGLGEIAEAIRERHP